ncbi:MAG: HK97 family phage prohead protease [Sphingopyxis sp.]|nr:MAG: HK97 family phage prohead protease [Sphingopyxis sp.]
MPGAVPPDTGDGVGAIPQESLAKRSHALTNRPHPNPSPEGEGLRDLRFAGYAAIFDRVDKGGDIIRRGAFGAFPQGKTLPLLWQHDPMRRIGTIDYVREDRRGLRVIGTVSTASRAGREAAAMLSSASVKGLSFGYRVKRATGENPRELLDLDVAEISLVTSPMQALARVHLVQQI